MCSMLECYFFALYNGMKLKGKNRFRTLDTVPTSTIFHQENVVLLLILLHLIYTQSLQLSHSTAL